MKLLNTFKTLSRQYQTRKHLRDLPAHLLRDIKQTSESSAIELSKNRLTYFIFNAIRQLFKGG